MEIERKWLVAKLPNLDSLPMESFERYFIYTSDTVEIRVQKRNEIYELERKSQVNNISRSKQIITISAQEFDFFKALSKKSIIRDSYIFNEYPEISIKIYHGEYEGLARVEVEFVTEEEAQNFFPFDWFGAEITNATIGRDKTLVELNEDRFKKELSKYMSI
ncbi:MAG: hypothetical protein WCO33_01925 [bacterium]